VDDTSITVKNLNGDVALNGTVPSYPQYRQAAAAARRVQGVTSVHNHLMVVLPASDYRDDPMLTTIANNALALNVTVPAASIEASASDGNIWLTGTVSYDSSAPTPSRPSPADRRPQHHQRHRDLQRRRGGRRDHPRSGRPGPHPRTTPTSRWTPATAPSPSTGHVRSWARRRRRCHVDGHRRHRRPR
jgi:hypothetical protein